MKTTKTIYIINDGSPSEGILSEMFIMKGDFQFESEEQYNYFISQLSNLFAQTFDNVWYCTSILD